MHNNVIQFFPTALAAVLELPLQGEPGHRQAALQLRRHVRELEDAEKTVIARLFGLYGPDCSVGEVARQMRLTPLEVVRLEERGLAQLRRMIGTKPIFAEAA